MNASQTIHPTDQTLHAYGAGKLENASAESVGTHLESCFDCRRRLALLSPDRFLARHRGAQGKPDSRGPIISSTDGLSMLAAEAAGSPAPPPASTLPPGLADHPNYVVTRELGRGGMGVVYLAQNTLLGRTEVLKVVGSHLISRRGVGDRFLAEVRNSAMLNHPNIVTAYSALRIGESLVLAMEHVDGLDLAKMVEARGPLPVAQACNYAHQAALGLQHAHERGMVHRDIKPSNLMLARQNDRALIKVLDFGLAKVRSEGVVDAGLTHEGQMLGTPAYIAPEQISNARGADIRADIYSLGCTLYCLLTGGPPFQCTSLYDILQAHHSMEATPLNLKRPEVPVELATLVAKMMAKEPKRRFQEPREVAQALMPFFRKGNLAFQSTDAEVSCAGQSSSGRAVPRVLSTPAQSVTNDTGPIPRQAAAKPSARETERKGSVDMREGEGVRVETPAIAPTSRPPWLWPSVAGGVLALALLIAWAVVVVIREVPLAAVGPAIKDRAGRSEPTNGPAGLPTRAARDRTNGPSLSPKATLIPAGPSAESLFNGSDLRGWEFDKCDARMWRVENQTLVAINPDGRGQGARGFGRLITERSFKEFLFRFEYQALSDFEFAALWWALPGELPPLFRPAGSTLGLGTDRAGGKVFSKGNPSELTGGDGWNVVEVEARDRLIRISVNGKESFRKVLPEKPTEPTALKATKPSGQFPRAGMDRRIGRVGFEVNRGTGRFRNIEIEELPPSSVVERLSPERETKVEKRLVEEEVLREADLAKRPTPVPNNLPKLTTNSIGMKLVLIPAGEFLMGSPESDPSAESPEKPQHRVWITRPFNLGVTEVTRGQFRRFVDDAGYQTEAEKDGKGGFGWNEETNRFDQNARYTWRTPGFDQTDEHPVVSVSWNDAVAFAQWLSRKEGKSYRLPTEAEWEYACRAGTTTRFSNGDNEADLVAVGNVADGTAKEKHPDWTGAIAARDGYVYTAPVGRFQANAFGLYDMHGNVWEWCSDGYAADYYQRSPANDPSGDFGAAPVIRGGSWFREPLVSRSASRLRFRLGARYGHIGFRVALPQSGR
jgi:formylglycine-generating enzyme required for sulfatase activity/serine/threonine protein kinase